MHTPDIILNKIKKEHKGKLTIFLGAAAGVGKTFAMLEAAREKVNDGKIVLVGIVETHGRKDTEKCLEGFEILPQRDIEYRGKILKEMDLDGIISLKPDIVLVDELAHTNVHGSRHHRRFMDVEEILEHGIDVYTTLNIQHLESLNDVVSKITGIKVHETVPDSILENTDNVTLIDIAPEDLRQRLKEGKIYLPDRADHALKNFFRIGNLSALRELSLRLTALKVDKDLSGYMHENMIDGPWPVNEKVMVCISTNPSAASLVRSATRLARGLKAETLAVYVEYAGETLDDSEQKILSKNMAIAEELGCSLHIISGEDISEAILDFAIENNVTHVVVGKTLKSKLQLILTGSIVDKLIHDSGGLNIHVVEIPKTDESLKIKDREKDYKDSKKSKENTFVKISYKNHFINYALSFILVAMTTVFCYVLQEHLQLVNISTIYILPVLLSAYMWGSRSSYFSAILSIIAFDYLFVPPLKSFSVDDIKYIWSFAILLVISFTVGKLSNKLRNEVKHARESAKRIGSLYDFSKDIAGIINLELIVAKMAIKAAINLEREVSVYLPDDIKGLHEWVRISPDDGAKIKDFTEVVDIKEFIDSNESGIAKWVYENGQRAGRSTDTLPGSDYLYIPLSTANGTFGVMGIFVGEKELLISQNTLADLWARLGALAIERALFENRSREAGMLLESERLRNSLFNSLSHELRTPLSSVKGASSMLVFSENSLSEDVKTKLYKNIYDGTESMERVVNNILDQARLESGTLKIKKEFIDIEDIIGIAVGSFRNKVGADDILINVESQIPLIKGDGGLLEQVLVNLIENGIKHGKAPVYIRAYIDGDVLNISVRDSGQGVSKDKIEMIFDKFYSIKENSTKDGLGLGLSICQGMINAHGGKINAYNSESGGLKVVIELPAHEKIDKSQYCGEINNE